jgi:light-regulated signal transduction histidine kinase (bacteriophytochrome)
MDRKIIFNICFVLLLVLVILEYFFYHGSLLFSLTKTAIIFMLILAVNTLFGKLKLEIEKHKNQHQLLEEKINERTKQLQELNDELYRSNKELENFAYIASHDLQEPLRKIRAFGDMLKKRFSDSIEDQGKEYIDRMQRASYRMQKLIDDLLNYSRVSRNPTNYEQVNLYELVNEVVEDLEETINSKDAAVRVSELPTINGDRRQLKQLFQNLVSNGIKFHKETEKPVVEIKPRWIENNGRILEIIISDNGIGFDEKYHDKIFTIFQRLHGRIEYEGTGIGLAICKKITENHNGTIYARSQPGVGSEFVVVLPYDDDKNLTNETGI